MKPQDGLPHDEIRSQLDRILGHREFQATERLRDFLRFAVEETLGGRSSRLKGYTIATEVFGRPRNFDATVDPIVRIEAGRLRRALERYYLVAGSRDPIWIDIPKGRYVPRFSRQPPSRTRASDRRVLDAQQTRPPNGPTITVVPFRSLTDDAELLAFANGVVEELVTNLSRYPDVIAIPYRGVRSADGDEVSLSNLGMTTGARFLLSGTVRRDSSALKVAVHLVDAKIDRQIWADSHTVDVDATSAIAMQEAIARDVIRAVAGIYGAIAAQLRPESQDTPPAELGAYDAMLRYHHYVLVMTPDAAEHALAALQHATQQEPEYGPAWSALANLFAHAYVSDEPDVESPLDVATEYARHGAALAPADPLTRTIMAFVHLLRDESDEFLAEAEVVLALDRDSPYHAGTVGFLLSHYGELDRGCALLEEAIARNPLHPRWFHHGLYICHFSRGDYDEAYAEAVKTGFPVGFWDPALQAAVLAKLGRLSEASTAAQEVLELKPDFNRRIREILPRAVKPADVREDFLDGLRTAGLHVD